MEAKLRELEQSSIESPALAAHPSLPPKPTAATAPAPPTTVVSQRSSVLPKRSRPPLPSLPLTKPILSPSASTLQSHIHQSDPPKKEHASDWCTDSEKKGLVTVYIRGVPGGSQFTGVGLHLSQVHAALYETKFVQCSVAAVICTLQ